MLWKHYIMMRRTLRRRHIVDSGFIRPFWQGEEEMPLQAEQTQRRPGAKRLTLNKDFSSNLSFIRPPPELLRKSRSRLPASLLPLPRSSFSPKALGAAEGQRAAPT